MTGERPFRIVLADDHELVRSGFRSLIQGMPDAEVVGEAEDGRAAVDLVRRLRPDVVLMDVSMRNLNGLGATARIRRECPATHVLILSVHGDEEYVAQALRAGAHGYILKGASVAELEFAIRAVARGGAYLTPSISRQVVDDYKRRLSPSGGTASLLTERQREVLQLVAEGATTKEIAQRLKVSVKTVETHRSALMKRLGLHDVAGLVRFAIREGLVSPET